LWIIIACWYFSIYRTERIENNTKLKIYYNSETFIRGLKKSFFAYILVTWIGLLSLSADTAATRAEWIKSGKMGSVIVNLKASLGRLPSHETPNSQVQFITATGQYVFLYEMNSTSRVRHHVSDPRRVHVVSKDSIASIERMARPSGD
jgi:hypothetical protein